MIIKPHVGATTRLLVSSPFIIWLANGGGAVREGPHSIDVSAHTVLEANPVKLFRMTATPSSADMTVAEFN